jgi:hypothetical protein
MWKVQRIIQDVLGEVVPEKVLKGSFSGGSSTSRTRASSNPAGKYIGKADITSPLLDLFLSELSDSPIYQAVRDPSDLRVVDGNILFVVPKTSDIDRCACKEPDINMYYQKGAGDFIRSRLRLFGIDLNDQSKNQKLARIGSATGSLATVDLSSASDSISVELVYQCLPTLWYAYLSDLRSPVTIIDGDRHVNEMFSSMGNGFTFELETLIFWAVTTVVCKRSGQPFDRVVVYGDDIIAPCAIVPRLFRVLSYLGFKPNKKKTHYKGVFRESCGRHYNDGFDVTPFYVKGPLRTLPDLIHLLNSVLKWDGATWHMWESHSVELWWKKYSSYVPRCLYGGIDPADPSCLVTGDLPRKRWVTREGKKRSDLHDLGGLRFWLWSKEYVQHELDCENAETFLGKYLRTKRVSKAFGRTKWDPTRNVWGPINQEGETS